MKNQDIDMEVDQDRPGVISDSRKKKKSAVGVHMEGMFEIIFEAIALAAILYATFQQNWSIFNDSWFYFGFTIVIISLAIQMGSSAFKFMVGKIRELRLVNSFANLVAAIVSIIILIIYPFTLNEFINSFQNVSSPFSDFDLVAHFIIGIAAILQLMNSSYNYYRYVNWKPSEHKSLLI